MPFVSFEGIDGSGKTEQVRLLVEHLKRIGQPVLQTKEPDGGQLGMAVRAILTNPGLDLVPAEQLLLVSAARFDHVRSVIQPALANGQWVVSDRFIDSTYAFQVAVSDVDLGRLFRATCEVVVGTTMPDLTIILDLPIEVARYRRERRNGDLDPAEKTRDFAAIRSGLLDTARENPERCHVINGDQSPLDVAHDVWLLVEPLLTNASPTN
ncbi:dTMP kinase [Pseudomonas sp. XWY-1]|uniref:dTMP kinase n=1 Tax=Pseudomonas TaxID=286 RepID=UPI000CF3A470|nr:dTMP kinase [Pseudomonas sp. XWY-1]MRF39377.1 dTMP kinase [Escherichia coli]